MPAQCPFQIGIAHITTTQPSGQNKLHHAVSVPYEPRRTCSREFARICPCAQMWALGSLAREGRYFQVELNSTCPHNADFKLVLPISQPLNLPTFQPSKPSKGEPGPDRPHPGTPDGARDRGTTRGGARTTWNGPTSAQCRDRARCARHTTQEGGERTPRERERTHTKRAHGDY